MADPITLSPRDADELAYVALAASTDDAQTDVVAGIACHIAQEHPDATSGEILRALEDVRDTIAARRPDPRTLMSADSAVLMSRILTRAVPALRDPLARDGAHAYSRAFLDSHRRGTGQLRQVAPIELQFDRYGEVTRFRRETWQRLYEFARDRPAVATAVDDGPIAQALQIQTTHDAATIVERAGGEKVRAFVADRL